MEQSAFQIFQQDKSGKIKGQFYRILDDLPCAFAMLEPVKNAKNEIIDFSFIYFNKAALCDLSKNENEIIGSKLTEIFSNNTENLISTCTQVLDNNTSRKIELTYNIKADNKRNTKKYFDACAAKVEENISLSWNGIKLKRKKVKSQPSDTLFKKIFQDNPDGFVISSLDNGKVIEVNKSIEALYGYSREEMIGKTSLELNLLADKTERKKIVNLLKSAGVVKDYNMYLTRKSGEKRQMNISAEIIDVEGEKCILTSLRDVTEQKSIEEALKQSEERFYKAFIASPVAMTISRLPEGTWIEANESFLELTGYSREEIIGHTSAEFNMVVEEQPGERAKIIDSLRTKGKMTDHELSVRTKDGKYLRLLFSAVIININGKDHAITQHIDLTQHRKAEESLRKSEERFRTYTETIPHLMFITDHKGYITYVNNRFYDYLGVPKEEILGNPWKHLYIYHSDDITYLIASWEKSISTDKPLQVEYRLRRYDGQYRWHLIRTLPITDQNGKITEWIGTCTDIHEAKVLQEEREKLLVEIQKRASEAENGQYMLKALMEYVPEGITIADAPDVKLRMVSRYGTELLGGKHTEMTAEEVADQWTIYHPDGETIMSYDELPLTRAIMFGEVVRNFELIQKNSRGEKLWLLCNAGPIYNSEGKITSGIVAWRDITELKRSENEHKLLAMQRQLALDAAHLGWWHYNPITKVSNWDDRYKEIFGVTGYQRPTDEILARLHPDDLPGVWACVEKALDPVVQLPYSTEYRIFHDDGSIHWIEAHGAAAFEGEDDNKHAVSFVGTVQDITERKLTQQMILENRAKLEAALNSMTDALFISDVHGRFVDFNDAFATFHKFKTKAECAKTFDEYPDILDVYMADGKLAQIDQWAVPRALRGETVTNAEYMLRRKDTGETWWGSYSFGPIRDKDQKIIGSVVVARDITEIKKNEEDLRQRIEEMETLMDVAPAAIWIADDPQCNIIRGNKMANQFYEAERIENVSANVSDVRRFFRNGIELKPEELTMQEAAIKNIDIRNSELDVLLPSGNWLYMMGSASPLRDVNGNVRGCIGTFVNVTEKRETIRKLEKILKELERSNADLERFAFAASHDLQEPIRMMGSYAQLLSKRYKGKFDTQSDLYLDFMTEGAKRLQILVKDLLYYSSLRTDEQINSSTDINEIVKEVTREFKSIISENNAEIIYSNLPIITADPYQLKQLFKNLISNALKFRKADVNPVIKILSAEKNNEWLFSVADNGIGIKHIYQEGIFKAFFRLNTREFYPGTGLGLAICKRIIERHEGRIWVESEPGKGSVFYFTISKQPIL